MWGLTHHFLPVEKLGFILDKADGCNTLRLQPVISSSLKNIILKNIDTLGLTTVCNIIMCQQISRLDFNQTQLTSKSSQTNFFFNTLV